MSMSRTRRTAFAAAKISLSIAALLVSSGPLAAEDTSIVRNDSSALTFRFYDNSTYAQVSRIRHLSFLTLVDSGKSRWFVGVNSDGVFGVHYRAKPRYKPDAHAELVRRNYFDSYRALDAY